MRNTGLRISLGRGLLLTAAFTVGVSIQWLASGSESILTQVFTTVGSSFGRGENTGKIVIAGLLLIVSYLVALRLRKYIAGPRLVRFDLAEHKQRSCVILIVSSEDFRGGTERLVAQSDEQGKITGWFLDKEPCLTMAELEFLTRPERLRRACLSTSRERPWPWQQMLRALIPHEPQLKSVWLVGSRGDKGSFRQLPKCRSFLQALLGPEVSVFIEGRDLVSAKFTEEMARKLHNQAVDFEDFHEIKERLDALLHRIESKPYSHDASDIVIDVTGGQKTTSIAAATLTLKSDVVFQYVQTDGKASVSAEDPTGGNEVLIYDAIWVEKPE